MTVSNRGVVPTLGHTASVADLFHVREPEPLLGPGEVIPRGRYGAIVLANPSHQHYGRETLIELVRVAAYPQALSRLTAAFALDSLGAVHSYVQPGEVVYRVVPVDRDAEPVRRDMCWLGSIGRLPPGRRWRWRTATATCRGMRRPSRCGSCCSRAISRSCRSSGATNSSRWATRGRTP